MQSVSSATRSQKRKDVQGGFRRGSRRGPRRACAATAGYSTLRNFKLDNAYPVVEGYQDAAGNRGVASGVRANFSDRLGATGLELTASYSPTQSLDASERLHVRAVFRHWNWNVSGTLNRADFYDLFGPTR